MQTQEKKIYITAVLTSFILPIGILMVLLHYKNLLPSEALTFFLNPASDQPFSVFYRFHSQLNNGNFSLLNPAGVFDLTMFEAFPFYLNSPFTIIAAAIPGDAAFTALAIFQIFRIGLAGTTMCLYLLHRQNRSDHTDSDPRLSLLFIFFSLAYALGSGLIVRLSDFRYLDLCFLFPLFMIGYEDLLYENKKKLFLIFGSIMLFCNASVAISILLIILIILVVSDNETLYPHPVLRYIGFSILCFFISAVTTIPAITAIANHGESYKTWPDFAFTAEWLTFFSGFLPNSDASVRFMPHMGVNTYFTLFFMLLAVLSFFVSGISSRKRLGRILSCAFILLSLNTNTLSHLLSPAGFEQELILGYDFIVIFFGILLACEIIDNLKSIKLPLFVIALALPLALTLISGVYAAHPVKTGDLLPIFVFFALYLIMLILYRIGSIKKNSFLLISLILMFCELMIHTEHTLYNLSKYKIELSVFSNALNETESLSYDPFNVEGVSFQEPLPFKKAFLPESYLLSGKYQTPSQKAFDFETVNAIFTSLGGNGNLFDIVDLPFSVRTDSNDVHYTQLQNNTLLFETRNLSEESYDALFQFKPKQSGSLYFSMGTISYIGDTIANTPKNLSVNLPQMDYFSNIMHVRTAYFNETSYHILVDKIKDSSTELKRNLLSITANIECRENSTFVLPIGRNNPSRIIVDGKTANLTDAPGEQTGVYLSKGMHQVEWHLPFSILFMPLLLSLCLIIITISVCTLYTKENCSIKTFLLKVTTRIFHFSDSINTWCCNHRIALLSFFIPFLILSLASILACYAPFGGSVYFKNDGAGLTLPNQYLLRTLMQNGNPDYSELSGGGFNAYYSNALPIANLWLLLFPTGSLIVPATILSIFRISVCGPSFYLYMTKKLLGHHARTNDPRLLIFTTAYALSAYILNFRHFLNWPYMVAALPLLLLCLDHLMIKKKKTLYILLLACCMILNTMNAIYLCVFLFFWFFTYDFESIKDFFLKGIRFGLSSILSAGMAFWILALNILSRQSLGYQGSDSVAPDPFHFYQNYFNSFKQLFLFSEAITITEKDGAINLYCGILIIPLLLFFILLSKRNKRYWIRLGLVVFIFFSSNNDLLSYIWNGLHYQTKVPNRYSFLLIFLLLDLGYEGFLVLRRSNRFFTICIPVISAGLLGAIAFFAHKDMSPESIIASFSLLIVYIVILHLIQHTEASKRAIVYTVLVGIFLFEITANNVYTFRNEQYGDGTFVDENNKVTDFLKNEWLKDDNVTRVTYLSNESTNQHQVNEVSSICQFSSMTTAIQSSMAASYGCYNSANNIAILTNETPFTNALLNIGYMITTPHAPDRFLDLAHYDIIGSVEDRHIFKNNRILSLGFFVPSSLKKLTLNNNSSSELANNFARAFNLEDLIFSSPIKLKMLSTKSNDTTDSLSLTSPASDNLPVNSCKIRLLHEGAALPYLADIKIVAPEDGEYYYRNSEFYYLGYLEKDKEYTFTLRVHNDLEAGSFVRYDDAAFQEFYEKASENKLQINSYKNGVLDGTVNCPEDGYLLLSIPFENGWSAFIDNNKVNIDTLVNGAMMLPVKKGMHRINMQFKAPGKNATILATIPFWILWVFILLIEGNIIRIKRSRRDSGTQNNEQSIVKE